MKNKLYSYYNKKAGFYNKPFVEALPAEAVAQSIARTCIIERETARKSHLDETALYIVGEFDDITGLITALDKPEFVEDFERYFQNDARS